MTIPIYSFATSALPFVFYPSPPLDTAEPPEPSFIELPSTLIFTVFFLFVLSRWPGQSWHKGVLVCCAGHQEVNFTGNLNVPKWDGTPDRPENVASVPKELFGAEHEAEVARKGMVAFLSGTLPPIRDVQCPMAAVADIEVSEAEECADQTLEMNSMLFKDLKAPAPRLMGRADSPRDQCMMNNAGYRAEADVVEAARGLQPDITDEQGCLEVSAKLKRDRDAKAWAAQQTGTVLTSSLAAAAVKRPRGSDKARLLEAQLFIFIFPFLRVCLWQFCYIYLYLTPLWKLKRNSCIPRHMIAKFSL